MIKTKLLSLGVLSLLLAFTVGLFWVSGFLHRPLPVSAQQVVTVSPGETLSGITAELSRRAALGEGHEKFLRKVAVRGYDFATGVSRRLHVGEYQLSPGDTLISFLGRLERGDVIQRSFTLIEGWNIRELRQALARAPELIKTLPGVSDEGLMQRLGRPDLHPEGWFAPDTYFYTAGESDVDILARAFARQQQLLEQAWQGRDADLPYSDAYDALIMASIVEKETGVPSEREEIAGVFVQRLYKGMRLQTDPTVIYGMGEAYQGNIRRRDLQQPTPYNTYVIRGLPPTPIAMPGAEAIHAAVHPAPTEALFFVARGDGSHKFSATLEEHEAAVREYQLKRREGYRSSPAPETAQ